MALADESLYASRAMRSGLGDFRHGGWNRAHELTALITRHSPLLELGA
jgi:hypothetical protein